MREIDPSKGDLMRSGETSRMWHTYYAAPLSSVRCSVILRHDPDSEADDWACLDDIRILLSSCPREIKLKAVSALGSLVFDIQQNAPSLAMTANEASGFTARVMESLRDRDADQVALPVATKKNGARPTTREQREPVIAAPLTKRKPSAMS
jgi:hypothetical protein